MYFKIFKKISLLITACVIACSLQAENNPYDYDMFSNIGLGHFNVRSLSPGHILRPNTTVSTMSDLKPGTCRINTGISWGNVWNYNPVEDFLVDGEWMAFDTKVGLAISENIEIGFSLPFSYRFGGILDSAIEGFHDFTGLDNENRDTRPQNGVLLYLENKRGRVYLDEDSFGINDIPFHLSWLITKGSTASPAIAIQIGMTIPTGNEDEAEGLGEPLFGLSVLGSKRIGITRHLVMMGATVSHTSQEEVLFVELYQQEYSVMAGWEYNWGSDKSIIAQYTLFSPSIKDAHQFSKEAHELNFGYKHKLNDTSVFEASIMENVFVFNNSTDIGLSMGLTKVF